MEDEDVPDPADDNNDGDAATERGDGANRQGARRQLFRRLSSNVVEMQEALTEGQ